MKVIELDPANSLNSIRRQIREIASALGAAERGRRQ